MKRSWRSVDFVAGNEDVIKYEVRSILKFGATELRKAVGAKQERCEEVKSM